MKINKFVKIENSINSVGVSHNDEVIGLPNVWPLVDENFNFINIITLGSKSGLSDDINIEFLRRFFPDSKYVYNCMSGPFLKRHYEEILKTFDAHMTLDFDVGNNKSLFMNHSMMARSLPFEDYFWPVSKDEKKWDFSILTWADDNCAKRWDRCGKIVDALCSKGFTGYVVLQRGDVNEIMKRRFSKDRTFKKYVKKGLLMFSNPIDEKIFHRNMSLARVGIFPNTNDAFPKHIIENILADKFVIISADLLIGKSVVAPKYGEILNFDSNQGLNICVELVSKERQCRNRRNSREKWIADFGFGSLAKKWAQEINRMFGTDYKRVFYLNHIDRIKNYEDNQIFKQTD